MKYFKIAGCIFLLIISIIWSVTERTVEALRDIAFYSWSDAKSNYKSFIEILGEIENAN